MTNPLQASAEETHERIAAMSDVAKRDNRAPDVREYVLLQSPRKPGEFVPMTELLASDLAFLLSRVDALESALRAVCEGAVWHGANGGFFSALTGDAYNTLDQALAAEFAARDAARADTGGSNAG